MPSTEEAEGGTSQDVSQLESTEAELHVHVPEEVHVSLKGSTGEGEQMECSDKPAVEEDVEKRESSSGLVESIPKIEDVAEPPHQVGSELQTEQSLIEELKSDTDVPAVVHSEPVSEEVGTAAHEAIPVASSESKCEEVGTAVDEDVPVVSSEPIHEGGDGTTLTADLDTRDEVKKKDDDVNTRSQPLREPTSSGGESSVLVTGAIIEGEGEVSKESGLESGQIEVDVLLHAEEDDLSVFSAEAAEADKALTLSSSHSTGGKRKPQQPSSSNASASSVSSRRASKSSLSAGSSLDKARLVPSGSSTVAAAAAAASSSTATARRAASSSSGLEASSTSGEKRPLQERSEVRGGVCKC